MKKKKIKFQLEYKDLKKNKEFNEDKLKAAS